MQLSLTNQTPTFVSSETIEHTQRLVVFIDADKNIIAADTVSAYQARIEQLIAVSGFNGSFAEISTDLALAQDAIQLQLVGIGKRDKLSATGLQKLFGSVYKENKKNVAHLTIALGSDFSKQEVAQLTLGLLNASYTFDKYKAKPQETSLVEVALFTTEDYSAELSFAQAVYSGQALARDVANEPANVCYPAFMAEQAIALSKAYPDLLKVTVVDEEEMAQLGMNSFLSVSKGSDRSGKLVIMEYTGKSAFSNMAHEGVADDNEAPIALVGKGVTFDTGGISIKPSAGMEEMKFDMGGSASVIGAVKGLCESKLELNVVAALACAENMPSARASRPGDIVKAMNGKTIEILNTDAEGRLVLCDTLCYVQERYAPTTIIDVATLTGACVVALGSVHSAVYSKDTELLANIKQAGDEAGDTAWHMPIDDEYQEQIDSPIADVQNIGGRWGGSITAACFLSRFIEEGQSWAHLDVAGSAWTMGNTCGATGRPVPLFMQFLKNCAEK